MIQGQIATVLTIAGSDSSAGAGIQADLKSIHALDGYALTVITAITAQNSQGVQSVFAVPAEQVKQQLNCLLEDYQIDAIKIGMLGNQGIVDVVTEWLKNTPQTPVVLDPIILSSSGKTLLENTAIENLVKNLFPLCALVTPNLPELNFLLKNSGSHEIKGKLNEMPKLTKQLQQKNWPNILLKGGHTPEEQAIDYLISTSIKQKENEQNQANVQSFVSPRITVQHNHGTGCTLSSAIATELAKGCPLEVAVGKAKTYLFTALQQADSYQPHYKELDAEQNTKRHGGLHHFANKIQNR
ncbi:MAG TPA: bifunctional hydroxymethylpyrimidine kinase/phosphomethylpyrimidine kinase [Thiomicrospira sp.]|jgi:hydroxymethylpyrimidine/phosphomethylpyrimidine kinase|nr:bifunctional hydroxymethylpyrimidine kinase/phosphomethylpyrimidine kinase [Thiomicrospira sp.]